MNATMKKFGYPDTLVGEYQHWVVLLRPQQATLGSLVLICKDQAETFSLISTDAFLELKNVTGTIESTLKDCFSYDKINYLMLMMVDPDVHFHVLPRYANPRNFFKQEFLDPGWPGPPNLSHKNPAGAELNQALQQTLQRSFDEQQNG